MTAAAVCVSGVIGWIGVMIPHMIRPLVGPRYDRVLPASMLMGAAFRVLVDALARSAACIEIPLGLLTFPAASASSAGLRAPSRRMRR